MRSAAILNVIILVFASLKTNTAVVVDTSKISFQNKPVSWVEEESCGDYRVTGTVQLCGLPVNSAIEALRYEYKPKADKTIWEYIHDRYNSISVTSLEQFIGRSTVWSIAGGGCSEQCCCKEGVDSATWSVDLAFASEAEALSFKEYLSDTLSYYVAFIKNTCTVVEAEAKPARCPKFTVRTTYVVCQHQQTFMAKVANEIKVDGLKLLEYVACNFPSCSRPATLLEVFDGLQLISNIVKAGDCRCSNGQLWEIVAGFVEEEEANAYMAFIATDYSKAMTDGGICNIFVENTKLPTDAVYTARATTLMCAMDDSQVPGVDGERGEYDYVIQMLQKGWAPFGQPMIDYIKDTYPSILYPLTAEQFANKHNVRATGYGWWCMDELSTCCCENPVEFQVRAHFGSKQDADYFVAQTMSMVLPAFLNEVVGVCTVNSYKGLFEYHCNCDQEITNRLPSCSP